jgi:hypothetical protein
VGARGLDAADGLEDGSPHAEHSLGRIEDPIPARFDVLGQERLAVVKLHVTAQVEGVELAVLADLPALGKVGDDLVHVEGIALDEPVVTG